MSEMNDRPAIAPNDLQPKPCSLPIGAAMIEERNGFDPAGNERTEDAARLIEVLRRQPVILPRAYLRAKILSQIRSTPQAKFPHRLAWIVLLPAMLMLFWSVFKPGAVMRWEVQSGEWETFKVYRSESDGGEFILLDVLSISSGTGHYMYRDLALLPGQAYIYQVQAEDARGRVAYSQVVKPNTSEIWLMWLAVILPACLLGVLILSVLSTSVWLNPRPVEMSV